MLRRMFVIFLLLGSGIAGTARAGDLQGPMRLRDLSPFALQRLDFQPSAAISAVPDHWALEVHFAEANTYVHDEDTAKLLYQRPLRTPLRPQDVATLESQGRDYFFYDGAISILNVTGHLALNRDWALYGALPVHHYGGGFMDSTIEGFHQFWGLDDADRPLVPPRGYQVAMRLDGERYVDLSPPADTRIADPTLGVRYRGLQWGQWDVVLESAIKLPVGNDLAFFSSGAADVGVQISLQRLYADKGIYVSLSDVYRGKPDLFRNNYRKHIPSLTVTYEQVVTPAINLIAQFTAAQSVFRDSPGGELDAPEYQASIGLRHIEAHYHWTIALTENLFNFNNTPDLALHAGIGWRF